MANQKYWATSTCIIEIGIESKKTSGGTIIWIKICIFKEELKSLSNRPIFPACNQIKAKVEPVRVNTMAYSINTVR